MPHGALHYIPFAALSHGGRYLIDDYSVFILPSFSAMPHLVAERMPWNGSVAVFAQPGTPGHLWLPGATQEAKTIANLFHTTPVLDATEADFRVRAPEARIIHIAAHADIDPEHPGVSKILFQGTAGSGGFLYLHDVRNIRLLRTDLVVLSACETEVGPVQPGDDLLAFDGAFLAAGSPSVVASLWEVGDAATSLLMKAFYRELQSHTPN